MNTLRRLINDLIAAEKIAGPDALVYSVGSCNRPLRVISASRLLKSRIGEIEGKAMVQVEYLDEEKDIRR